MKIIDEINKLTGRQTAMMGNESVKVESLSTGIMKLDWAIGIGGFPKGRVIEMHGQPSSGKTTICLQIIKNYQDQGIVCAFVDAEHTLDIDFCESIGVDMSKLIVVKPEYGEEAFDVITKLINSKQVGFIVVDSISAMVPKSRLEADTGTQAIGAQARMIANELPKIISPLDKTGCILVFINQLRVNIMGGQYNPYTTPGGMSLRHYCSVRLKVASTTRINQGDTQIGSKVTVEVVKNKVGKPNEKIELTLMFDSGFSESADILDIAQKAGVITRLGITYYFNEVKLGAGENKARSFLADNEDVANAILEALRKSDTPS